MNQWFLNPLFTFILDITTPRQISVQKLRLAVKIKSRNFAEYKAWMVIAGTAVDGKGLCSAFAMSRAAEKGTISAGLPADGVVVEACSRWFGVGLFLF